MFTGVQAPLTFVVSAAWVKECDLMTELVTCAIRFACPDGACAVLPPTPLLSSSDTRRQRKRSGEGIHGCWVMFAHIPRIQHECE